MSGTAPSAELLARVRAGEVGGVIFFARNVASTASVASFAAALQHAAADGGNPPLLVSVDQEGGAVRRLPGPPDVSEAAVGTTAKAHADGVATGAYLHGAGVNVNFAPVLDTPESAHNFLGTRAYSRDAQLNAQLGAAFVEGVQAAHVAATAKHFPGLGTAAANTDVEHVYIRAAKWKLDHGLLPFRAAVNAGVKLVMISNAGYAAYDASGLPAVLSQPIVTGLLRVSLGYGGAVISDAFEAPGPSSRPHPGATALNAGVDLLLYTSEPTGADGYGALLAAAQAGLVSHAALAAANARIAALKHWLAQA